jgi:N,N'-diacetyllegionaminate synthase
LEIDLISNKVFIIAEAGVNHNGSIDLAKKLIDIASKSGADAVKFQSFKAKNLVTKNAIKARYQNINTGSSESQYDMINKLELSEEMHHELILYCKTKNIMFLSSPFDHGSIELLNDLGLKKLKIPSGELTNMPYIREIGKIYKKVILSSRMTYID